MTQPQYISDWMPFSKRLAIYAAVITGFAILATIAKADESINAEFTPAGTFTENEPAAETELGGWQIILVYEAVCEENWDCTDWTINITTGQATRTCIDTSSCGTTVYKPEETITFGPPGCTTLNSTFIQADTISNPTSINILLAALGIILLAISLLSGNASPAVKLLLPVIASILLVIAALMSLNAEQVICSDMACTATTHTDAGLAWLLSGFATISVLIAGLRIFGLLAGGDKT